MTVLASTTLLALGWFAAVNAALSLAAWAASLMIRDRVAGSVRRAQVLLAIRLLPTVAAAIVTLVLFAPSHARLEPVHAEERYGVVFFMLAALAVMLAGRSAWRIGSLLSASRRLRASIDVQRRHSHPASEWVELPFAKGIALTGLFRPRLLIGAEARAVLTGPELDVVIAHEVAHRRARDNATRVVMWCLPDFLGLVAAGRRVERLWDAEAECLADARAVQGSAERALRLASALVKIARLGALDGDRSLAWSRFHQPALLETRVRRLVGGTPDAHPRSRWGAAMVTAVVTATALAWITGVPAALHGVTELLVARLP